MMTTNKLTAVVVNHYSNTYRYAYAPSLSAVGVWLRINSSRMSEVYSRVPNFLRPDSPLHDHNYKQLADLVLDAEGKEVQ